MGPTISPPPSALHKKQQPNPFLRLLKPKCEASAMFPSFSTTTNSYGDPSLHHPEFCSATSPHGLFPDSSSAFPSSSPPCTSFSSESYLHGGGGTHSLPFHHHYIPDSLNQPLYSSSPSSSSCDYLDFNAGPVRRVLSTGNLQGGNGLHENSSQEGGVAGRVGRYSAEERKERIERYRSKRNQRNFHKKITYECRKTLADSRPRVRGRFARNGETETEAAVEMETGTDRGAAANYEQNQLGGNGSDCWRQLQAALAVDDEDEYSYDEEFLASFSDFYSMNTL